MNAEQSSPLLKETIQAHNGSSNSLATTNSGMSASIAQRRVLNNLPAFIRQNLTILSIGFVLIITAISFHTKVLPDKSDIAAIHDSLSGGQIQTSFDKFRHHSVYNYEKFRPIENTETTGMVEVAFDEVSGKIGQEAKNTVAKPKKFNLYFREYTPEKAGSKNVDVILLHGAAFTSLTWKQIDTLQELQSAGYRAIAVDLPGSGESPSGTINPKESAIFVQSIFKAFGVKKAVLISPSMSGRYAVPYVFNDVMAKYGTLKAWIPVAPVSVRDHREAEYAELNLKTFIVYGEKDSSGRAQSLQYLAKIPNSDIWGMIDGDHPCYMTNPKAWNEHVLKFLKSV